MDRLPKEIINKIFYFTCHPVAAMFNDEAHLALEQYEQNDDLYYKVVKEIERKQRTTHLNGRCDYCFKPFSTCNCRCGMCDDSFDICQYSNCRYGCHNNNWTMTYIKYILLHKPAKRN